MTNVFFFLFFSYKISGRVGDGGVGEGGEGPVIFISCTFRVLNPSNLKGCLLGNKKIQAK